MASKRYFDIERFDKLMENKNSNSYSTLLKEYEDYLEDYPYDTFALSHYFDLCIDINELKRIENLIEDISITKRTKEQDIFHIQKVKLKYYSFTHQFEKCYEYLQQNKDNPFFQQGRMGKLFTNLEFYLRFQLNLLKQNEKNSRSYLFNQILHYDIERAAEHIKKHMATASLENDKFLSSVNLIELLETAQKKLPNQKHHNNRFFQNKYQFKSLPIGYVDGDVIDLFTIITLDDTSSIITMYPEKNRNNIPVIDITSDIVDDNSKVKRKSQIEIFNERYSKKI